MKGPICVAATLLLPLASGFSNTLFQEVPTLQKTAPSKHDGVDIELPDFDELFDRIQQVSPLAKQVIQRSEKRGFSHVRESGKNCYCSRIFVGRDLTNKILTSKIVLWNDQTLRNSHGKTWNPTSDAQSIKFKRLTTFRENLRLCCAFDLL